ncbi:uncharacterized protein LOC132713224 [Ruditapes philippinarum]|uniref:uncharacterized protein LOC132713224 n=1 Tax=Ruditapes philippinarum TaxID=129788 RepID=UPI00295BE6A5|nr:uncharacterized protein LOC132713224 [Ruditapes philippinarum]
MYIVTSEINVITTDKLRHYTETTAFKLKTERIICYHLYKMDQGISNMDTKFSTESKSSERFTSILEVRRMKRKEEEEADIEWCPTEKQDEADVARRMDSIIDKLKRKFKEEKQARKQPEVVSIKYKSFCNSVDAFLRHQEYLKVRVKYSTSGEVMQSHRALSGEIITTAAVTPDEISDTGKISVDTPTETSQLQEENDEDNNRIRQLKYGDEEGNDFIPSVQSTLIVNKSKVVHIEAAPVLKSTVFQEITLNKQLTAANESDIKFVMNSTRKSQKFNGHFIPLKQKKLNHGHWVPQIYEPCRNTYIDFNRKPVYLKCYEETFKPVGLPVFMVNTKCEFGGHICMPKLPLVNKFIMIKENIFLSEDVPSRMKLQAKIMLKPSVGIQVSRNFGLGSVFNNVISSDVVERTRKLVVLKIAHFEGFFGHYFSPVIQVGRDKGTNGLALSSINDDGKLIFCGGKYINIVQPFIVTTTLPDKQVTVDTAKEVSTHLDTEDSIKEDSIGLKLKSIKRFETPENFSVGTAALSTDGCETIKQDNVCTEQLERIEDDIDDESQFGILSVYCRSGIHSC